MDVDPETKTSEGTQDIGSADQGNSQQQQQQQKTSSPNQSQPKARVRSRKKDVNNSGGQDDNKRRCVSTACKACRKRKSKFVLSKPPLPNYVQCTLPEPASPRLQTMDRVKANLTECVYDPNSDHRRKGVYKKDIDKLKTRNSTLEVLIQAILNLPDEEVAVLVRQIRTCESLDAVAEGILAKEAGVEEEDEELLMPCGGDGALSVQTPTFESQLSGKMGQLQLGDGSIRYLGGTSNLIYLADPDDEDAAYSMSPTDSYQGQEDAVASWTNVTDDPELIMHLINMYFTWHYTYFTTLSKSAFYRDFLLGKPAPGTRRNKTEYCSSLLVNAMLALGCHFTSWPAAREDRNDSATAGDQFFREAKRLIMEYDEHEKPKLTTVQAFALMSVREAGCGREAKGWVYSGMSFRMACDLGLQLDSGSLSGSRESQMDEEEVDARRITFWGCFLFDKCWSNYLGRLPQLPPNIITVPKFDVFPMEDSDIWAAYTDSGVNQSHAQPSRTRAVALQLSALCEISSDLMSHFYNPTDIDKTKGKAAELKKLSDIHQRLETWRRNLPQELEPKEGGLPAMLVMHMFFQLLYIHLFRPFLKYNQKNSPLPPNVSPRRLCTQAAAMISKLLRLYKRSHGLRQICNIAVYILHTACTIHLLNLPDKNAKRDITHGIKHLEEMAEAWLCARRTLAILSVLSRKWKVDLPNDAAEVLSRTDAKYGAWGVDGSRTPSQKAESMSPQAVQAVQAHPTLQPSVQLYNPMMQSSSGPVMPPRRTSSQTLPPQNATEFAQANTGGSPSALFGGVDQLLRDQSDWWLRDQTQLAVGFEHWPMAEEWLSNQTGSPVAQSHGVSNGVNGTVGVGVVGANGFGNANGNGNGGGFGGASGYGGSIGAYNENEWYS
ncbi:hypothetical protein E2P81_ATG03433 [Venturia nashicola]|uniref:Xylanolytic transcriptional activator regulatory domain-containing protein n=1 Tax=Venturia nashicola TaxID=86259 RepID=A0A4Z1P8S4_9PEZI|nr:hypothetical protein E6O75_ATG03506 [Venturia nashicola]TLD37758.1 hypothetical protein E2P81_ATG03433 [Venturia nashicola]